MTLPTKELQYKKTVNRIACSMLIFWGSFLLLSVVLALLTVLKEMFPTAAAEVAYQLLYGFIYAAIFVIPVFFFRLIVPKRERAPVLTAWQWPRGTWLYIFAAIGIVTAVAFVNDALFDLLFDRFAWSDPVGGYVPYAENYELVLQVFTVAVVPAFVEELLFRGVVLCNLLPYGRTTAVLASSFLFGMMHQNPAQFLYTMAAGLVLGYVYVYTKSIWPCVLTHFCNNFLSIMYGVVSERIPAEQGIAVLHVIECTVVALGVISAMVLMLRSKNRAVILAREGCFERDIEPDPEYAVMDLPWRRRVRLFFTVPMIIFLVLCVLQALPTALLLASGG